MAVKSVVVLMVRQRFVNPYATDLTIKEVRKAYDAYRKALGIPGWCPLSDKQRKAFDLHYLRMQAQKKTD